MAPPSHCQCHTINGSGPRNGAISAQKPATQRHDDAPACSTRTSSGGRVTRSSTPSPFRVARLPAPAATEMEIDCPARQSAPLTGEPSVVRLFAGGGGGTLLGTSCEAIGGKRIGDLVVSTGPTRPTSPAQDSAHRWHPADRALAPAGRHAGQRGPESSPSVHVYHGGHHPNERRRVGRLWCTYPEFRHAIAGAVAVESFSMNAHKWLLANNDCCVMRVKPVADLGILQ
ncbi:hypothetical protein GUJ93_ZPchr0007g4650 [Zizania palustris]|uniref:Uncharacterized protein n=1 Tax=Zizania palustris TaxID=103762 RepID=A0A8J5W5F2_ZIZPA|nr:hypothetical protein GUJ93_ZPchr0007g4650 [Zizania palustris]